MSLRGDDQRVSAGGGACVTLKSLWNVFFHGQPAGRCTVMLRADCARRAETWFNVRRVVVVVAFASRPARSARSGSTGM